VHSGEPTHLGTANAPVSAGVPGQIPMQSGPTVLSNQDFLARVEAAKADIRTLTQQINSIASAHQRSLSSTDTSSSSALESIITQTQVLNTSIKDQIKFLEVDAARSGNNNIKNTQVGQLKTSFKKQLEEYRNEEASYERRYREQIARQYRIVNPDATEQEVQEASNADWGNEGVFQTAVSPPTAHPFISSLDPLTIPLTAQNQPHSHRLHRPRRRPRPPQRHSTHRAHTPRAEQAVPGPGRSGRRARAHDPASGAAHGERQAGHRSRQRPARQGHQERQKCQTSEMVALLDRRAYPLHHRPCFGTVFWVE